MYWCIKYVTVVLQYNRLDQNNGWCRTAIIGFFVTLYREEHARSPPITVNIRCEQPIIGRRYSILGLWSHNTKEEVDWPLVSRTLPFRSFYGVFSFCIRKTLVTGLVCVRWRMFHSGVRECFNQGECATTPPSTGGNRSPRVLGGGSKGAPKAAPWHNLWRYLAPCHPWHSLRQRISLVT